MYKETTVLKDTGDDSRKARAGVAMDYYYYTFCGKPL